MRLVCKCFNVKVMTKADIPANEFDLNIDDIEKSHLFFQERVYEVSGGGIKESFPCLLRGQIVGSWNVRQCKSCKLHTHAINCKTGVTVASSQLREANTLTWDDAPNYCQVFQILVPQFIVESASEFDEFDYSLDDEAFLLADKKCKGYIDKATEETMAKIAMFEAQNKQILEKLKDKVYRELKLVKKLLLYVKEQDALDMSPRVPREQFVIGAEVSPEQNIADNLSEMRLHSDINHTKPHMCSKGEESKFGSELGTDALELEDDVCFSSASSYGVFEMDDFDSTSLKHERVPEDFDFNFPKESRKPRHDESLMAQSAPVRIPRFESLYGASRRRNIEEEKKTDEEELDIGASIKKLAKSVRLSSADVFGDLPRPKLRRDL